MNLRRVALLWRFIGLGTPGQRKRRADPDRILSSGIFDAKYYGRQVGADFDGIEAAVAHFLRHPSADVDPHVLFSTSWYRRQAGLPPQTNALLHYIDNGHLIRHDPHPLFMSAWYSETNRKSLPPDTNPLSHYLCHGWRDRCPVHPLFDEDWYRSKYADVGDFDFNAFEHYAAWGLSEGKNPCEFFDTVWYDSRYRPSGHGLAHYMAEGAAKGFNPSPLFDTRWYAANHSDVARSGLNPLVHFIQVGRAEGRMPLPKVVLDKRFGADEIEFDGWRDVALRRHAEQMEPYDARWAPSQSDLCGPTADSVSERACRRLVVKLSKPTGGQEGGLSADLIRRSCDRLGIGVEIVTDIDHDHLGADLSSDAFVLFLREGDVLDERGLAALWASLRPPARLCVFDMFFTIDGRSYPVLLPGFNLAHLRAVDCTFSRFAIGAADLRRVVMKIEGVDDRAWLLAAIDRIATEGDFDALVHVAAPVLRTADLTDEIRRARDAALSPSATDPSALSGAKVSIIICTKDKGLLLDQLLSSLFADADVLIADVVIVSNRTENAFAKRTLRAWAAHPRVRVLSYDKPFNFSEQCNLGVAASAGEFVLFLNDDIAPVTDGWLRHLMAPFADPSVGVTGPLLVYPNEQLQHGGMYIGNGSAHHALRRARLPDEDYLFLATCAREVSMVTGAALLMRRACFDDLNGFDTQLASIYQDVDLCLRVSRLGHRILYVPKAILIHMESVSLLPMIEKVGSGTRHREVSYFRRRYEHDHAERDPFFNPKFEAGDETLRTLQM